MSSTSWRHARRKGIALVISLWLAFALVVMRLSADSRPAFAQCDSAPPGGNTQNCNPPPPTPTPQGGVQTLVQVFQQIIQFPAAQVQEALENAFKAILKANIAPMRASIESAVGMAVFGNTPILGNGLVPATVFQQAWEQVRSLSFFLWPMLLGIVALVMMTKNAVAAGFEVEEWWQLLLHYGVVVLAAATSIYWMDGLNNIAIEMTRAILSMGGQPIVLSRFTEVLLGGAITAFVAPSFSLIATAIMIIAGFLILVGLVLQFTARYALLFVFVSIAPVALLAEILPLTKWLSRLWLKGFVLTILLQPINALLFKFTAELLVTATNRGLSLGFVGTFLIAAGVLSMLVTLNFTVLKFVYGGIQEVMAQAGDTVKGMVAMGTVLISAAGLGVVAGGASGASAVGGTGGGGAGGAGAATVPTSAASGGATSSRGFNVNRALETAGSVLAQGTNARWLGGLGAGLRAMGAAGQRTSREAEPTSDADGMTTRDQMNLFRQMADEVAPRGTLSVTERDTLAHGLFATSQQHGVDAVKSAWTPVATSVRNTLDGGGASMRDVVEQSGYRNIPDFVQGQVAETIRAQGNPLNVPGRAQQRHSETPTFADYKVGTYLARQLGSTWRADAAAIGEMHHYLRTQTKDGAALADGMVREGMTIAADGQPEALGRFVRSTSDVLSQHNMRASSDLLTGWRQVAARHLH
ncbi:MAG: hypothetical protein ABI874_00830 [Chloroflexota bacterium]